MKKEPEIFNEDYNKIIFGYVSDYFGRTKLAKINSWNKYKKPDLIFMFDNNIPKDYKIDDITLVPFEELNRPVVYNEEVFNMCVQDWDGDCILKDNLNGVQIIKGCFHTDNNSKYEEQLTEYISTHPFDAVKQIMYKGKILNGPTLELQLIIDLYYQKNVYI